MLHINHINSYHLLSYFYVTGIIVDTLYTRNVQLLYCSGIFNSALEDQKTNGMDEAH